MYVHHRPGKRSPQNALTAAAELVLFSFAALLLLSLSGGLFSPQALAYEEDIEKEAVKAAIEAFLHSYAEEAMLYIDSDQTVCTVAAPEIVRTQDSSQVFTISGKDVTLAELQENIRYVEKKAMFYSAVRRMQEIYREDLRLSYRYTLTLKENTCHASVTEAASFYYTDSERPSVYETIYSIDLVKIGEQWLVADITDGSRFDSLYKKDPAFEVDAALAEFEANLHTEACSISAPYDETPEADVLRIPYYGANAAAYAYTYSRQSTDTDRADFYNPQFKSYAGRGGDCMNFVSQCMWAGFGGSQAQASVEGKAVPMDTEGDSQWYGRSAGSDTEAALGWISCQSFRLYLTGALDGAGTEGSNASCDTGMYATILDVGTGSPITGVPAESLVGAAAHVEGAGGNYAHAIILTAATGTSRSEIWFCSHTKDLTHVKLGDYYFGPMKVYIPRYMRLSTEQTASIQPDRVLPAAVSSPAEVGFHMEGAPADLTLSITAPGETAGETLFFENSQSCSVEYFFSTAGLYRIDCSAALEGTEEAAQSTFYVLCYEPPVRTSVAQETEASEEASDEPLPNSVPPDWLFS